MVVLTKKTYKPKSRITEVTSVIAPDCLRCLKSEKNLTEYASKFTRLVVERAPPIYAEAWTSLARKLFTEQKAKKSIYFTNQVQAMT